MSVPKARKAQESYVAALTSSGLAVSWLPAEDMLPDSCFVEDQAVILDAHVLLPRSAHPVRGQEQSSMIEVLRERFALVQMAERGTLDGGDVLVVGRRLYVGVSDRTNTAGAMQLCALAGRLGFESQVLTLPPGVLHLKCVCSTPAPDTILLAEGTIASAVFKGLEVLLVPEEEAYAANVVGVNGHVLVAHGYERTHDLLVARGLEVHPIDTEQFRRRDGSLTCLSLID